MAEIQELQKTVVKGSFASATGLLSGRSIEYFNRVLIARFLGPELFGLYSLAVGVLNLGIVSSNLGFRNAIPRFVANYNATGNVEKSKGIFFFSLLILLPLSLLVGSIIYFGSDLIAYRLFSKPNLSIILKDISFIIPLGISLGIAAGYLQGRKEFLLSSLYRNTLPRLLFFLSLTTLYLLNDITVRKVILGLGLGYFFSVLVSLTHIIRTKLSNVRADLKQTAIISYSWPLGVRLFFAQLGHRCDLYVMGYYLSGADIGQFSACLSLATLILVPQAFINKAILPIMSELIVKNDYSSITSIYESIINWLAIVYIPILFLFILFAEYLTVLFFGENYSFEGLTAVFSLLAISSTVGLLAGPNGMLLLSLGRTRIQMLIGIFSSVISLVSAIVLISSYGIIGAAISNSIYVITSNVSGIYFIKQSVSITIFNKSFIKIILSGALSTLLIFVLKTIVVIDYTLYANSLYAAVFLSIYFIVISKMKIFMVDELSFLKIRMRDLPSG